MKKDIMFVCTGNTCRSPMAEGIMRSKLDGDYSVISRGISVPYEGSVSESAVVVMKEKGIDISAHKSRQFDLKDVTEGMIILTMTSNHKRYLLDHYPNISGKLFTISEIVGASDDVVDPFGGSIEDYRSCAQQLETLIDNIIKKENI